MNVIYSNNDVKIYFGGQLLFNVFIERDLNEYDVLKFRFDNLLMYI